MAVNFYNYLISLYEEREARKIQRRRIRDVCDPFDLGDREFQSLWRISKPMAHYIVGRLSEDLEPQTSDGLPVHLKVLCSIQFLANGGYQRQVGQDHTMCQAQTTVSSFLGQFLTSIYRRLLAEWVHFPGSEPSRRSVASEFEAKFNVPGIVGLLDCTHIKIFPPSGPQGAHYKNRRKDAHTINVQLICDSNCRILSVNARYPGRVHDAFIWHHSSIQEEMKRLHDRRIGNYFLLGDSGYPLEPWLMTPILHAEPNSPQQRYTDWHCQVRNAVERTNGYLKGSLRCLGIDRVLHYSPEKASEIIYACCIIYNLMKHFGVPLEEDVIAGNAEQYGDNEPGVEEPRHLLRFSRAKREQLIANYFN
ncbi:putative nuclease HARBI1 [Maniola hyperantus]|uniref:putative nuclease HARBI1 n=1 Tax=Aphantopus hyperantus TaxID=2795564 RepID=UPI002122A892